MIVYCRHFSQLDCPLVFENEQDLACEQLSMHLNGSHGLRVSAEKIAEYYKPVPKEKIAKIETISDVKKTVGIKPRGRPAKFYR